MKEIVGISFQDACDRLTAAIDGLIEIEDWIESSGICDDQSLMLLIARERDVEIAREDYLTAEG